MCGIYGATRLYPAKIVQQKLDSIKFRGPDCSDFKVLDNKVILGQNRLSIIDLAARSNQPFQYKHLWITYNGEVYNYQSIRTSLSKKGYTFRTASDTEVICAAYLEYGKDCVQQFNGMFAFVIYDQQKQSLFGARDRMGQKPFYYTLKDNYFEFASQIYPISIANSLTIDENSIQQFLFWSYIIEPNSIYKEIKTLKAGHAFSYDLQSQQFKDWKYWEIDEYTPYEGSYEAAKKELKQLLIDAVEQRMVADVPLGVFLSGGIDSSLVAAIAQSISDKPIKTFSVKFKEAKFDESGYAQQVADYLKTDHTVIECSYEEGIELIEHLTDYYQQPFADSSAIPTTLLAKHTRKHVTVALSGDAGDESFLGYERYDWIKKVAPIYKLPKTVRKIASAGIQLSPNARHQTIAKGIGMDSINELYMRNFSTVKNAWMAQPEKGMKNDYEEWLASDKPLLERVADFDLKAYLNSCINTKVDRASMAYSLEARAPLEDYSLVAFARSLPTAYKYCKGNKKRILKEVLYDFVPKSIFDRPKMGFGMPLEIWFRGKLKSYVQTTLSAKNLAQIPGIYPLKVQELMQAHFAEKADYSQPLWNLMVLVNWMQKNGYLELVKL